MPPSLRQQGTRFIRLIPRSYRVRLVLAFCMVVAVALGLVLATLPRLLDGYFEQQEETSLQTRANSVAGLVAQQLTLFATLATDAPRPLLLPGTPLVPSDTVTQALGDPTDGFVARLTPPIAQADVLVTIAPSITDTQPVYSLSVPLSDRQAAPGQQRESLTKTSSITIADRWWTQTGAGAPVRLLTVTLSDPFTYRAQTAQTITSVLLAAASLALLIAIGASVLLAQRLTNPIRRLTQASRSLAEGQLDARVSVSRSSPPEVTELATAFNNMAERLQQSINIISGDRDRSRGFLADVSHELRTPIAALRTFNELLREGAAADPATRDEFLEQSGRQIERLDWLSTNLLELSKLDSGLVALDLRPDDLRVVAENAVEQAEPVASRKGVTLQMHVPAEPVRQPHDPQRLGQVLSNLIGNAIKFTPKGGRVDVELAPTAEGAEFTVSDTGVGIDAEELPHVFERFYRGTRTPTERATGSGLGLSIVKSIVDMHGGRIAIQTTAGAGTRVSVTLPRDMSNSSPTAARS